MSRKRYECDISLARRERVEKSRRLRVVWTSDPKRLVTPRDLPPIGFHNGVIAHRKGEPNIVICISACDRKGERRRRTGTNVPSAPPIPGFSKPREALLVTSRDSFIPRILPRGIQRSLESHRRGRFYSPVFSGDPAREPLPCDNLPGEWMSWLFQ